MGRADRDFKDSLKIRLPASLKARLAVVAQRRMVGLSDIIREQMLAYLALNEPAGYVPPPRRKSSATKPAKNGSGHGDAVPAEPVEKPA
jgi:hypothetical protein